MISNYVLRTKIDSLKKQKVAIVLEKEQAVAAIRALGITKQAAWKQKKGMLDRIEEADLEQRNVLAERMRELQAAWRQTNTTTHRRKGIVNKGVGDILGYTNTDGQARMVAAEVKTLSDRLSPDQREFLGNLSKAGGIAYIATQVNNQVQLIPFDEYVITHRTQ